MFGNQSGIPLLRHISESSCSISFVVYERSYVIQLIILKVEVSPLLSEREHGKVHYAIARPMFRGYVVIACRDFTTACHAIPVHLFHELARLAGRK